MTALVEGGVVYPWSSYQVLVPLVVGIVLMGVWLVVEAKWVREPSVPWDVVFNRTSLSG